jgi:hypothetical protein
MQLSKIIISFFLLFVYTAGVAHELIPHHQDEVSETCEYDTHSSTETHNDGDCGELTCFTHTDHCDDGFIDLLSCLFSDESHPDDDCTNEAYLPSASHDSGLSHFAKIKLVAVYATIFNVVQIPQTQPFFGYEIPIGYLSPPLHNSSNRGPPVV